MEFRKELGEFLKKSGISQNKAGEGAGYTGSVVSQYLAGSYKGAVEEVEAALRTWMVREQKRRARKYIPIAQTETLTRIINAVNIAHEEMDIAVVVGETGTGKTTAARKYIEENSHSAVLIEVDKSMTALGFVRELAEALRIDRHGNLAELTKRVWSALRDRDTVVIVDEADYLNDGALELARRVVNDKGQSGLVLIGLPRLVFRLKNLKNDHQQLASRVGVLLEVDGLKRADAKSIVASVWPEIDKETVDAFFKTCAGSVRHLCKLIDRAWRTVLANGQSLPDLDAVQVAGSLILR
jgi:DNA transposition AAA+ family ATPase